MASTGNSSEIAGAPSAAASQCRPSTRTKALREAERKLEAARTRSGVNVAAKKVIRAKAELKQLEGVPVKRPKRRATRGGRRRALPHCLLAFVDLKARSLQLLNHPLDELLARIIGEVLLDQPAHKIAAVDTVKPIENASWWRKKRGLLKDFPRLSVQIQSVRDGEVAAVREIDRLAFV